MNFYVGKYKASQIAHIIEKVSDGITWGFRTICQCHNASGIDIEPDLRIKPFTRAFEAQRFVQHRLAGVILCTRCSMKAQRRKVKYKKKDDVKELEKEVLYWRKMALENSLTDNNREH